MSVWHAPDVSWCTASLLRNHTAIIPLPYMEETVSTYSRRYPAEVLEVDSVPPRWLGREESCLWQKRCTLTNIYIGSDDPHENSSDQATPQGPEGCRANLFHADEPKPQLEQLSDAFWSYVSKATQTTDETIKMIRESQLGQEVNARLTQSADVASEYAVTLKKQMDPLAEELMNKITKETEVLRERLGQDLVTVREQLEPFADNMRSQIQQRVEELRTAMAPYADSLDSETLKATLLQKSEELRGNLEQSAKDLQAQLEPYATEIREKVDLRLQEFQKTVTPLAEDLQAQIRERAQMVQQSLTPYAEDLKEKLDPYAQDLQAQLTSLYESFIERSCRANLFHADEPKPQLEQLSDAFWSYVSKATQTTDETIKMIRESQLGQEVNARLTQSADVASEYAVTLKKQMDPLAEELMNKITKETEVLRERLGQDLVTVREQLEPFADNMRSQIQQRVEELRTAMAPYADSLDSETLKATLLQKSEELRGNLEQSAKDLQAQLEPYATEIREKVDLRLQEFQKTVTPLAEDLQAEIRERAQMVQQSLTPYAEDLKEKLDPYAQDLQAQLTSLRGSVNYSKHQGSYTNHHEGCRANLFHADEPKPQLEQLSDAFWSYVSKATQTADETIKMIRESQLGQEVNARLTQSADVASEYAVTLKKQMDPLAEELMNKITKETEVLRERLGQDLVTVREQLEPFADNMRSQIQQRVEELRTAMAPYADSLDSETLKATLLQKSEELRGNLEQSAKDLQAQLEPYATEIREKVDLRLQEFQKTVTPLAEDLQAQIRERAQMVQQSLTPYAEDLREKLDPYAQDLQAQLTSLYESFIERS
ncbi:hypothetical protein DNTS_014250 [Danionella cerebrum]|uniref:Apolipoprotein A-IV n=1 Tax=Danionella cerebrum TaxID=2873325 RepID=A0A553QTW3_9TELE|nr:hypothetical protein DNTS_014250 [Danionella translucida]